MKRFRYSFTTRIEFDANIELQDFLLRAIPADTQFQRIAVDNFAVAGCPLVSFQLDSFGNPVQYGRVRESLNFFEFKSEGVAVQTKYMICEDLNPLFRYPSALTAPSPQMANFLKELDLSKSEGAYKSAVKICGALAKKMSYKKGSTDVETTAAESFAMSAGVCQDFAHTAAALCRMADIPARYVSGLIVGEGESHAWIEIWDSGRWLPFDPANDIPVEYGYIKISHGRDSADAALNRGVIPRLSKQKISTLVKVSEIHD